MNKVKTGALLLTCAMVAVPLAGCGNESYSESTLQIDKKGRVLSYSVEDFGESYYSEEELGEFVEKSIDEYKEANSDAKIKLNSLKVEDGVASLSVSFNNCKEYSDFSEEVLYNDTVVNAKAEGYDFDATFYKVEALGGTGSDSTTSDSGEASPTDTYDVDSIIGSTQYKVVITSERTDVVVPGKIVSVSDKFASIKDEDTVDLYDSDEIAMEGLVYIVYE